MITALLLSICFAQDTPDASAGTAGSDDVVDDSGADTPADDSVEEPAEPAGPEPDPLLGRVYEPKRDYQVRPDSPYWELEVMYHQGKHKEGAELAEKWLAEKDDPHLAVYVSRFWYQYLEGNEKITDKQERMAIYQRGLDALEASMEKDPDDAHMKFAYGVLLGRMGTTRGVLASLRYADDIEGAWLEVVDSGYKYGSIALEEEVPCDTYLALGIFYRLVPDSWIVKALAGTRGDLDKSLEMQEKGVQCSGDKVRNLKELGVTQMCIGTTREQPDMIDAGRKSINRYLALEPRTQTEIVDMKHGIMLLSDPTLACEYSRDGQQDLDEKNMPKE